MRPLGRPRDRDPASCHRRAGIRGPRPAGNDGRGRATVRRLSCVQLDSISTVERSHRIALGSRIRAHPKESVYQGCGSSTGHTRRAFYRLSDWPLFRPARGWRRRWYGEIDRTHPHLREHVLDEIRARGRSARALRRRSTEGRDVGLETAKRMLELLSNHRELVVAGRQGFQRLYDERVLDRCWLRRRPPSPNACASSRSGPCGHAERSPVTESSSTGG